MNLKQLVSMPRIIGIILTVIAVLAYQTQSIIQVALLAIAGLVLLLTPTSTGTKRWQEFLASLKFSKETALIMLFDVLFWALLVILFLILRNVLETPMQQVRTAMSSGVNLGTLQAGNAVIESFFTTAIIAVIVFWLLAIIAYSISRGLIWLTLLDKPLHKAFFAHFSMLNLLWCTVWLVLLLFFLISLVPATAPYTFLAVLIAYTHLTTVLHYSYTKTRGFGKAFADTFASIGKLNAFAHPYCYLFIVYVILNQVQRFAHGTTGIIITALIALAFMAWYRTYMRNILRHIA